MDASFNAQDPGQVAVTWSPADYSTPVVVVVRDGEPVSIHTNGHNYVPAPGTTDDQLDLENGQAQLYDEPEGLHDYSLGEWVQDPDTGLFSLGACSDPVTVDVAGER